MKPINFTDHDIKATLSGIKTQVRPIVKPIKGGWEPNGKRTTAFADPTDCWFEWTKPMPLGNIQTALSRCPYGKAGDRLWVREAWRDWGPGVTPDQPRIEYRASEGRLHHAQIPANWKHSGDRQLHWMPAKHMPQWASRITLEITDVRIQRLQDISEADAAAEGVVDDWRSSVIGERGSFQILWEIHNGRRPGYTWNDNPFVWVIAFKQLSTLEAVP